jgi:hypothetical protein
MSHLQGERFRTGWTPPIVSAVRREVAFATRNPWFSSETAESHGQPDLAHQHFRARCQGGPVLLL